ncbi:integrase core domain protein [Oesophagostomum dentatum]|uniref:Integrase core domain protein n=1 Tax=Oesophagostomum dentatum TaxID=61180 RepID=A0A0B1TPF6_OESDE|nr:integrase core domain protein [Oesophagostomum dentatum]
MPVKTVLNSWAVAIKPRKRIHIDYAGPLNGKMCLVVVDAYSKWPEAFVMSSSSTAVTLRGLRILFAPFGNPGVIVSDNGPQFTATEFQQFCMKQGIACVRSPPFHPQSNGQAERFSYRTPSTSVPGGLSPPEIFLGRWIRTLLTLLKEPTREIGTRNEKMEAQFSRHYRVQEKSYQMGESVWVRDYRPDHEAWIPARVTKRLGRAVTTC